MKLKDFLKGIADKTGVNDADFAAVLGASAINDIDLPETYTKAFDDNFLTRERAKSDPGIVGEIQKQASRNVFNTFDEKSLGFLSMLDQEDQEKIKTTKETFEKFDLIRAGLKKALTAKGGSGNSADVKKIEEEWSGKLKLAEDNHQAQIKQFKDEQTKIVTNSLLTQKVLAANFADAFKPMKESIAEVTVNKLSQGYKIVLDKGQLAVMREVEGTLREVYEGNEKVTIDKLIEKELLPFIPKSAGAGNGGGEEKRKTAGVDISKLTLGEMRALQSQGLI